MHKLNLFATVVVFWGDNTAYTLNVEMVCAEKRKGRERIKPKTQK